MSYRVTPTSFLVHKPGARLFEEGNIIVRVEDESDGPFLVIESLFDDPGGLRVSFSAWESLCEAVEAATRSAEALTPEEEEEEEEDAVERPHTYALIYVSEDGLRHITLATSMRREDLVETKRALTKLMVEGVITVSPMEIVAR